MTKVVKYKDKSKLIFYCKEAPDIILKNA